MQLTEKVKQYVYTPISPLSSTDAFMRSAPGGGHDRYKEVHSMPAAHLAGNLLSPPIAAELQGTIVRKMLHVKSREIPIRN